MRPGTLEASGITIAAAEGRPVPRQLDGIQVLRGIAAAAVVLHHCCAIFLIHDRPSVLARFQHFTWVGACGVDIFFCISGFVIVYSLLCRGYDVSWQSFVVARIKRIIPLYWVFTLLILAFWLTGRAMKTLVVTPDLIVRSFLLLPLTKRATGGEVSSYPILDQGWTLQYEALFYLACTVVIALLGSRRVFPWTPAAVALIAAIGLLVPGAPAYFRDPLLAEFVGGTVLGWLAATGRLFRLPASRLWAWSAIAIATVMILLTGFIPHAERIRVLVWGIPGFLLVFGCILVAPRRGTRLADTAIFLGTASYSIYLAHVVVLLFVTAAMKAGYFAQAGDVSLILLAIVTIAATSLVHPLIEKPLTRLVR